jgi:4-amino-4-deoxy-L-arabinose transferase-like glycosyltransferase
MSATPCRGRADAAVLCVLAVLASVLLLANLGNQYLWQDEAQTALLARSILAHGVPLGFDGTNHFSQELGAEYGPDGLWRWHTWLSFYAVAASFALFGQTALAARLPFALCGVATVLLTWSFARELWRDRMAAGIAAGLLALSVPFLILARQSRWYALATLLELAGLFAYLRIAPGRRGPTWALLATALLLFHTHFLYCALLLGTLALHAALLEREKLRPTLLVAASAALLCGPWALWLAGFPSGPNLRRLHAASDPLRFARTYLGFLVGIFLASGVWLAALLPLALRRVWRGEAVFALSRRTRSGLALVALHTSLGIALLAGLGPDAYVRYLMPLVPPLFALGGLLVGSLVWVWPALGVATAAAWILATPLDGFVYEITHDYDGPEEGIVEFLRQHARPTDVVAIVNGDLPVKFYTGLRVVGGLTGEDLAEARDADWIILRSAIVAPVSRRVREALRRIVAEGHYARRVIDYPDTIWENREDLRLHRFRTDTHAPRVEIWERQR